MSGERRDGEPRDLPGALEPLAFLVGTWRGEGTGQYPTIEPFTYGEELFFGHSGRPFLTYRQRTWSTGDGAPLHAEVGYVRPAGPGRAELVVAQPSGIVEVDEGEVEGTHLTLTSTLVGMTSTAKSVGEVVRSFTRNGRRLEYTLDMAAVGIDLARHLHAILELDD